MSKMLYKISRLSGHPTVYSTPKNYMDFDIRIPVTVFYIFGDKVHVVGNFCISRLNPTRGRIKLTDMDCPRPPSRRFPLRRMFADLLHGAVHGRAAAEDHGAGGQTPAPPRAHRQPRRLRDGREGEGEAAGQKTWSKVA